MVNQRLVALVMQRCGAKVVSHAVDDRDDGKTVISMVGMIRT